MYVLRYFNKCYILILNFLILTIIMSCQHYKDLKNPNPELFEIYPEVPEILNSKYRWYGGESRALQQLKERLDFEKESFVSGFYIPNQINPDLLGPPSSLSAALRYGCLSIRMYYI